MLRYLYETRKLSTYKIARRYNCDSSVIQNRLKEYGLFVRSPKKKILISKRTLKYLYIKRKLSIYKIAKIFKCASSCIYNKLKEYDIETRPLKKINITKYTLQDLYIKQCMAIGTIAKLYKCSPAVILEKMRKYGIDSRSKHEANTKYKKYDFSGEPKEKAYMIGFRLGDLNAKLIKNSSLIGLKSSTTKMEQVELIKNIFSKYGRFYVKENKGTFYVECTLNKTFSFLLPKKDWIEDWILKDDHYFLAFLAGYTDAEGNIGVYSERARFRVGTYDRNILHQIYKKLNEMGIRAKFRLETPKGYSNNNEDFWRVSVNEMYSILKLLGSLEPYLSHPKRVRDNMSAKQNIIARINTTKINM